MRHVLLQRKKWRVLKQSTRFASQPNYARSQRPSDINIHTFIRHFLLICNAFNCGNLEIKAGTKDSIIKRSSRVSYAKQIMRSVWENRISDVIFHVLRGQNLCCATNTLK